MTVDSPNPLLEPVGIEGNVVVHEAMAVQLKVDAFASAGVKERAWVVPLDTQGVVISMAQS